jgi:hypothetical protein
MAKRPFILNRAGHIMSLSGKNVPFLGSASFTSRKNQAPQEKIKPTIQT